VPQAQVCQLVTHRVHVLGLMLADIYCASRSLYGLAKDGQAPRIFAKARENGNPIFAVGITSLFICLGYMNASKSSSTVFGYFVSLVTVFAVLNWVAILISHIRFRQALKSQGIVAADLPYVGFLQPYGSYFSLFISLLVIVFNGKHHLFYWEIRSIANWDTIGYDAFIPHFKPEVFVLKYLGTVIFVFNFFWWKVSKKTTFWSASDVDLNTGRREWEETERPEEVHWEGGLWKNVLDKFKR
jgi:amino acid transporter